ncbi:dihydrolipoamide acetyltransferase family protein [Demequina sp. SYSU T00039]|uniref:Dihydrolipoamide acetyltransferase component of pyruvate dehydrogenase complex n=1 Tax=Demequina lignilytica TaxID=3051663 RepID=A0AAW7M7Q1_9MICO|nr:MULTISPECIES: dihydrolipoamide acetyltransferase family protein [unclassified Demequina]MDN4477894.1 dihydrolipoamide acetyltransferase family protein [Demequina sp. SYSU T00039-1]MDN4487803.1 dihydrolipoamide acetyltransferase family protein [Demequina sp. SYSU T00039]
MPTFEIFHMPDAGEGLTEADVVTWRVAVGDTVEVNQPLVEIETAKSLVELPCPVDGVVTRLLVTEGETVEVGAPIVEFDVDPGGEAPPQVPADDAAAPAATPAPEAPAPAAPAPAPAAADEPAPAVLVGYGVKAGAVHRRPRKEGSLEAIGGAGEASEYPVLAKPPVRKLAKELGVELTTVTPSGPGGLVTREDVEQAAKAKSTRTLTTYDVNDDQPWLESGYTSDGGRSTRVPVRSVRKRTAEAMVRSAFTAPHVTVFHTVDVTESMELVKRLKADREFADVRVTPLLIAAKALLLAVRRHPEINASWDDEAQEIVYKHFVNLGIAASTPRGLLVPNIKDAHRLPMKELAIELGELTALARANRTSPASLTGGTITITNVGTLGIDNGTPILNPGESAILAFGAIREQPWVHDGEIKIRWVTQLALSFDHRLVDGELGARVLADIARVMNDPAQGLVWG